MRVGGDDQVGAIGDRIAGNDFRIRQHVHRQSRRLGGQGETVVRRGNDHADELDAFLAAQRLEHGGAEVARSRQNQFHRIAPILPKRLLSAARSAGCDIPILCRGHVQLQSEEVSMGAISIGAQGRVEYGGLVADGAC